MYAPPVIINILAINLCDSYEDHYETRELVSISFEFPTKNEKIILSEFCV